MKHSTLFSGDRSEVMVVAALVSRRYVVSKPIESSCPYDLVIEDRDGRLKRVQVKTGRLKFHGSVIGFNVCKNHYRAKGVYLREAYDEGVVDYFAVYVHKLRKVYLIPSYRVGSKSEMHLRRRRPQNGQKWKHRARKYLLYSFKK